jgi:hypothetical protein
LDASPGNEAVAARRLSGPLRDGQASSDTLRGRAPEVTLGLLVNPKIAYPLLQRGPHFLDVSVTVVDRRAAPIGVTEHALCNL